MHVYRECNEAADCLAKLGHNFPKGLHELINPPISVREVLHKDKNGCSRYSNNIYSVALV